MFSLSFVEKQCTCGGTYGHYEADGLQAVYSGPGIPLGIGNDSFRAAVSRQQELNLRQEIPFPGAKFEAWIVPANSSTFTGVCGEPRLKLSGVQLIIETLQQQITAYDQAADEFPGNDDAYLGLEAELDRLEKILKYIRKLKHRQDKMQAEARQERSKTRLDE